MASSSFSTTAAAIMAAALLLLATITVTEAQGTANFPSCASKLVPCAEYIGNTTKPPATCCDPIKEAVKTELPCLCNLYNTPGLLNSFGINVTQAIGLTKRCGISADISNCSKAGAQSPTSSAVPTPPSRATPTENSNSNSGSSKMAWGGFSSVILIWVAASSLF